MQPDCPFCRKLSESDSFPPGEIVWQFPHSVAILGPWQYYHGYCILVARTHAAELRQLEDGMRHVYLEEMCLLARAMEACFRPRKLNYELLGNQVPHLHWHLFPRYEQDPDRLKPVWVALERAEQDPEERKRLQQPFHLGSRAADWKFQTVKALQDQLARMNCPRS